MEVKIIEIRDSATFIAVVAVNMNSANAIERWYLYREGYPCDDRPNIAIAQLGAHGQPFQNDPYGWGGRTFPVAHGYIIDHWEELKTGDVVDVEYILGMRATPKMPERLGG